MYLEVRVGKRGEIVIPAPVRKRHKIEAGTNLVLNDYEYKFELLPKKKDVVASMRARAKRAGLKSKDLVYGDKLYEEAFG